MNLPDDPGRAAGLQDLRLDWDESSACPELAAALAAEVAEGFGPRDERPFAILAREPGGALAGGVNGVTHWGWCYVRHLFVAAGRRRGGLGTRLLTEAERLARGRGCRGIYLDTFDPGAEAFYLRLGYERAGVIEDFPPGHRRTWLAKRLAPEG